MKNLLKKKLRENKDEEPITESRIVDENKDKESIKESRIVDENKDERIN